MLCNMLQDTDTLGCVCFVEYLNLDTTVQNGFPWFSLDVILVALFTRLWFFVCFESRCCVVENCGKCGFVVLHSLSNFSQLTFTCDFFYLCLL